MIQVTQAPQGSVLVQQQFTISGIASPSYAGRTLSLTVDNQYNAKGPAIDIDGNWTIGFLFQQAGSRRLKIAIDNESAEVVVQVIATPAPPANRLRFVTVPQPLIVGQAYVLTGDADGYANGAQLLLRADQKYELARPTVQVGKWQAVVGFNQPGSRLLEVIGTGQDRAQTTVTITGVTPPRLPRVSFTNLPQGVKTEKLIVLQGGAEGYSDGAELVLRADQRAELARPKVQAGRWQATVLFHQSGKRLIEIIGSEQDRAQITLDIQATPASLTLFPRTAWTTQATPTSLPDLQPKRITLHHTTFPALAVSASQAQEVARMQSLWSSHVNGNGWSDLGYHYIIMPSGRIYVGRSERKRGSHDVINDGLGVAFDGLYTSATISNQQFQSAIALCTQLCQRYGFKDPVTPVPTPTYDFGIQNLPLICGHRDRVATACPGTDGGRTVRLAEIRQTVKTKL
ncbi:MAG: peptidoglycan recognition family protein [Stenomitos frigidus ULC029]